MNQYQKVYMNQIHSSSLLGQLAQMWKSQMLCDALIRTGNITTKAHRVVLVAACPMLQSMDNASIGSHLEVRLAADIKQDAVNSFLQYLYEGFMMLTEDNVKDIEKVARLLQVDNVTKCCIDFYNCLQKKTGATVYTNTQYKYSSADLLEFRHVRTTDLQKTIQERMMKRAAADSMRPTSPSGKRQRMHPQRPPSPNIDLAMFGQKADDTLSMAHSYMGNQAPMEPWDRVPRIGASHRPSQKSGVIEIVEDSLEILQTQPPDKDKQGPTVVQKSLAISVSSQVNPSTNVHVVNVNDSSPHPTGASDGPIMSTGRDSITVSPLTVMPGTSQPSSISSPLTKEQNKLPYESQKDQSEKLAKRPQASEQQSSTPQRAPFPIAISPANMSPISQNKKSFAAGSATQAATMSQEDQAIRQHHPSAINEMERPPSLESGKDNGAKSKMDDGSASNSTDMTPDISLVKIEPNTDPGLDMYVDVPEDGRQHEREQEEESDLELEEASGDWSRDEMSNEAASNDQNNSWYIGQFKDWLRQRGEGIFFEDMTTQYLNNLLGDFYIACARAGMSRDVLCGFPYQISRYLSGHPLNRNINIEMQQEFVPSCQILQSIYQDLEKSELGDNAEDSIHRPIKHEHLQLLYKSPCMSGDTPESLQNKVWIDVNLYFGVFSRKSLRQLEKTSFVLEMDYSLDKRYYRIDDPRIPKDRHLSRMYEQPGNPLCPVQSMLSYYARLHQGCSAFFQQPDKSVSALEWYHSTPVGKNVHSGKLSAICQKSGLKLYYRNTALRAVYRTVHARWPDYTYDFSRRIMEIISGTQLPEQSPNSSGYILV